MTYPNLIIFIRLLELGLFLTVAYIVVFVMSYSPMCDVF